MKSLITTTKYKFLYKPYETLLLKKNKKYKSKQITHIKIVLIGKTPTQFHMNGTVVRKKYKNNNLNQTVTFKTNISNNNIKINIPTQYPLVKLSMLLDN